MMVLRARTTRLLVVMCLGLLLSGCVTMAVESDFEDDGAATHSMTFTIDTSAMGDIGQDIDPTEGFDEAQDAAEAEGYRVELIQDGDIVGMKISTDVEDSSDLGAVLNDLYNANSAEDSTPVLPFAGTFTEVDGEYRLELTVNGEELVQGAGDDLNQGDSPEDFGFDLSTIFDMTYTANMPGEIDEDETNGEILGDGRVQWDLPLTGTQTLVAVSSGNDDDGNNLLVLLLVGGIILLGLIGIAVVAFIVFMSRRGSQPATASAGYPGGGIDPAPGAQPYGTAPASQMGSTPPPSTPPTIWSQPAPAAGDTPPSDQPTRPLPPADQQAEDDEERPDRPTT